MNICSRYIYLRFIKYLLLFSAFFLNILIPAAAVSCRFESDAAVEKSDDIYSIMR